MLTSPFPESYEEWRHCITVDCGIPLTAEFVASRLETWRNSSHAETQRFRKCYGEGYLNAVIGWFEQAERELKKPG